MYHQDYDQPAVAKTGDLNEDLGQIEYIFSDKTGTLTENQMMFRRCSIAGKTYGTLDPTALESIQSGSSEFPEFQFYDPDFYQDLNSLPIVRQFIESLALCHTIIPQYPGGKLEYQGTSPDEQALVIAAHCFGFQLTNASGNTYTLKIDDELLDYEIIGIN